MGILTRVDGEWGAGGVGGGWEVGGVGEKINEQSLFLYLFLLYLPHLPHLHILLPYTPYFSLLLADSIVRTIFLHSALTADAKIQMHPDY